MTTAALPLALAESLLVLLDTITPLSFTLIY